MAGYQRPGSAQSPRLQYSVQEPEDVAEASSEQSASIDSSSQFRFNVADMQQYLHTLQNDRDALNHEVGRLQQGLSALFQAIQKPTTDLVQLQTEQVVLNDKAKELEDTKQEVTASIAGLTTKCSRLDQVVVELREKLEAAVTAITEFQSNSNPGHGSRTSLSPSDRSVSPRHHAASPAPADPQKLQSDVDTLDQKVGELYTQVNDHTRTNARFNELLNKSKAIHDRYKSSLATVPEALRGPEQIKEVVGLYKAGNTGPSNVVVQVSELAMLLDSGAGVRTNSKPRTTSASAPRNGVTAAPRAAPRVAPAAQPAEARARPANPRDPARLQSHRVMSVSPGGEDSKRASVDTSRRGSSDTRRLSQDTRRVSQDSRRSVDVTRPTRATQARYAAVSTDRTPMDAGPSSIPGTTAARAGRSRTVGTTGASQATAQARTGSIDGGAGDAKRAGAAAQPSATRASGRASADRSARGSVDGGSRIAQLAQPKQAAAWDYPVRKPSGRASTSLDGRRGQETPSPTGRARSNSTSVPRHGNATSSRNSSAAPAASGRTVKQRSFVAAHGLRGVEPGRGQPIAAGHDSEDDEAGGGDSLMRSPSTASFQSELGPLNSVQEEASEDFDGVGSLGPSPEKSSLSSVAQTSPAPRASPASSTGYTTVSRGLATCGFPGERSTASPSTPGDGDSAVAADGGRRSTSLKRFPASPARDELAAAALALSPAGGRGGRHGTPPRAGSSRGKTGAVQEWLAQPVHDSTNGDSGEGISFAPTRASPQRETPRLDHAQTASPAKSRPRSLQGSPQQQAHDAARASSGGEGSPHELVRRRLPFGQEAEAGDSTAAAVLSHEDVGNRRQSFVVPLSTVAEEGQVSSAAATPVDGVSPAVSMRNSLSNDAGAALGAAAPDALPRGGPLRPPSTLTSSQEWLGASSTNGQKENTAQPASVNGLAGLPGPATRTAVHPSDMFSIDSKDSCKPERCESPSKLRTAGKQSARTGQGTTAEPAYRKNIVLSQQERKQRPNGRQQTGGAEQ